VYLQKNAAAIDQNSPDDPESFDPESFVKTDNKPKLKRLTIDLTDEEHRLLKGRAAQAGLTMRKLVLQILHREGVLGAEPNGEATKD